MPKPAKHVFVCNQSRPANHPRSNKGDRIAVLPTRWWLFDA